MRHAVITFLFIVLLAVVPRSWGDGSPIVAAASDLRFALREISNDFTAATGRSLRLNFGSSGHFRRQIAQGAPFQLYLSADEGYVLALHREGYTRDRGVLYAIGRIAIIAPEENAVVVDGSLAGLSKQLTSQALGHFAIANPEHAPYGVAAKQALQSLGLWTAIEPRLIFGENVSQAAQFALSGNTEGGIVGYALALAPTLQQRSVHALIPGQYHEPLRQRMVLLKNAGDTAQMFYDYLQRAPARELLKRYGFMLPEDTPPPEE